jgi:spermidine/putrescine transport system permease protein
VWQVLFFYLPILALFSSSLLFTGDDGSLTLTFRFFTQIFTSSILKVIFSTIAMALLNAIICLLLGYPLAYYIALKAKRSKNLCLFLLFVPFWTNFLLHIFAWFFVLERGGFLNNLLLKLHLIEEPLRILNTPLAIMIMMVYFYITFMILPLYLALDRFDKRLIEASYDLEASWFQTFKRVILPLSARGIKSGFFLVYIPSFAEFAIPELMGGDKIFFVGNLISLFVLGNPLQSAGAAFTVMSTIFLLLSAWGFYAILNWIFPSPPLARGAKS